MKGTIKMGAIVQKVCSVCSGEAHEVLDKVYKCLACGHETNVEQPKAVIPVKK